jgi:hypothetical protein
MTWKNAKKLIAIESTLYLGEDHDLEEKFDSISPNIKSLTILDC